MYLQILNYLSYFFSILFIAFLCYALDWKKVKLIWKNAVAKITIPIKIAEATKEGKRPFYFNNGKTTIYAETEEKAKYEYRILKYETKKVKQQLKTM